MPTITVSSGQSFEVEADKRLVLALEDNGIDILHRCGGHARCTTCRVRFIAGEPEKITEAEYEKLSSGGLLGEVRLSCQIMCENDMTVEPVNLLSSSNYSDPGGRPRDHITPDPVWRTK
jgi:ferredoxin